MVERTGIAISFFLSVAAACFCGVGKAQAQFVDAQCRAEILDQVILDWAPDRTARQYGNTIPQTICCVMDRSDLGNPAGNFYTLGRVAARYLHPNSSNPLNCSVPLLTLAVVGQDFPGAFTEYAVGEYEFASQMREWLLEDRLEYAAIQEFGGLGDGQIVEFGCTQDGRYVAAHVRCPCGTDGGACIPRYSNLRVDPIETAPGNPIQPIQQIPQGQLVQPGAVQPMR